MFVHNKKGMTLATAVILILFASAVAISTAVFIGQRSSQQAVEAVFSKVIYLAQAGVNYAIYQYRNSATLFSGTVNLDANTYAVVSTTSAGGGGGGFVIDAIASYLTSGNRNLEGIILQNTGGSAVTVDRMIVTWTSSRRMQSIVISGSTVWTGNTNSPTNANITNTAFAAGQSRPLTRIRWNNSVNGQTITLQLVMTDGSTTDVCTVYPTPATACGTGGSLDIVSMGKVTGSNIYRTIEAEYDSISGKVTDVRETATIVP